MNSLKRFRIVGSLLITLVCAAVACVQSADAATLIVTNTADSGAGTLRAALASASDGDTINFAVPTPSTITLTSFGLTIFHSITIAGPGPANLAVNGNNAVEVFDILGVNTPGVTVAISGLTITNGNSGAGAGGGIYNFGARLTLSNCFVVGNSGHRGGGINNVGFTARDTTLQIIDSVVSGNVSTENGGGIFNWGEFGPAALLINNSTLSGNLATNGFFHGGGIYNFSPSTATVEIVNSTISSNAASSQGTGGGIVNDSGTVTISNSTFSGNSSAVGGGIENDSQYTNGVITVVNSTLSRNWANFGGGGIENDFGDVAIINSTLSGNSVGGPGGAIISFFGPVTIANSTLSGNLATNGAVSGIFNYGAPLDIGNTILNNGSISGANISNNTGTVTSDGYNLSSDDGSGFLTAAGDHLNTDPKLGPLQNNGGPTYTHALLAGSPAIDAGDPSFTSPPDFDQRGPGFPRVVGGRIDIGAFETQGDTPTGTSIVVQPADSTTGTTPVTLTFSSVTQAGTTTLTTSNAAPALPAGFSLGSPPVFYELATTAIYSGPILVCINFSGISFTDTSNLKLLHFEGGVWVDHTVSLDTINSNICGTVTSLSPFAIVQPTSSTGKCPQSQGYWKNNPGQWPVSSLTLGSQSYSKTQLLAILKTPITGDASLILADQLIAAKLNIANGSDPSPVSATIAHADTLLAGFSGKLPYKVKPPTTIGKAMTSDGNTLDRYNEQLLTPGCTP